MDYKTKNIIKLYVYIFIFFVSFLAMAQTQTENYIKTTIFNEPTQTGVVTDDKKTEKITYYDGLGRPFQQISIKSTTTGKDVVIPIEYDNYGRKVKDFLPYAVNTANGNLHVNAFSQQANFYNTSEYEYTINGYSEKSFDASPLNRILEQGAAGTAWKLNEDSDSDHTVKFKYLTNTYNLLEPLEDNVIFFGVSHPNGNTEQSKLIFKGYFPTGALLKTITKDENWQPNQVYERDHTTEEFKDKYGRVILMRTYNENQKHDTYYVYDVYGNRTYAIPPRAVDDILITTTTANRTSYTQLNFSWINLVSVDKSLAQEYQKKLSEYKNENILAADIENKYNAQGGFSISVDSNSNDLILNINFSSEAPLPLRVGEIQSLKAFGSFKDTELGAIKTNTYSYTFLIRNNTLVIEGQGKLDGINQSFSSSNKLNYSNNYSWASLMDIDSKIAYNYLTDLKEYNNSEILSANIPNDYNGQGGIHVSIDENDIVSLNLNITTGTPLSFKNGKVINLGLKRKLPEINLGTIAGEGYEYRFFIQDNVLNIEGEGTLTTTTANFTGVGGTATTSTEIVQEVVDGLCYIYHYDKRNRLIEEKVPGKSWEYTVYDKHNRPVFTQDGNLRLENKWLVVKYDDQSRPILTGLFWNDNSGTSSRDDMQSYLNSQTILNEHRVNTPISGSIHYYSNDNGIQINELHSVTYYDDYSFNEEDLVLPASSMVFDSLITQNTTGLTTGTKVRVLGTNKWITSITHYDKKARSIYVISKNEYLETLDITENNLNFADEILETRKTHSKNGQSTIIVSDTYTYDIAGRLLTQKQQINDQDEELIVSNTYDDLGQLKIKDVGNTLSNPLQTIDYKYNIRGWLQGINDINASSPYKLFSFKINYNTPEQSGIKALYNGNISETYWKTLGDNQIRSYGYNYDALTRLIGANYKDGIILSGGNNIIENYSLDAVSYDKNGNILSLSRYGLVNDNFIDIIDNLTYDYVPFSNTLINVSDVAYEEGFKDIQSNTEGDYSYDANGNMTSDNNKGIAPNGITYNHLNLPTSINVSNQGSISYVYDATGIKLEKTVTSGEGQYAVGVSTMYAGNFLYEKQIGGVAAGLTTLKFFNQTEGYVEPQFDGSFSYVYQYKDHLGNIRLTYQDIDNNGSISPNTEIIKESHFYPFGLKHKGYNSSIIGSDHKFEYNGKEIEKAFGVNLMEMDMRQYDPAIARWTSIDPVTHHMYSTYSAFDNNPIFWSDPSGADSSSWYGNGASNYYEFSGNVSLGFDNNGSITTSGSAVQKNDSKPSDPGDKEKDILVRIEASSFGKDIEYTYEVLDDKKNLHKITLIGQTRIQIGRKISFHDSFRKQKIEIIIDANNGSPKIVSSIYSGAIYSRRLCKGDKDGRNRHYHMFPTKKFKTIENFKSELVNFVTEPLLNTLNQNYQYNPFNGQVMTNDILNVVNGSMTGIAAMTRGKFNPIYKLLGATWGSRYYAVVVGTGLGNVYRNKKDHTGRKIKFKLK